MSIQTTRTPVHADPCCAWLRDQTARLQQRHLQFRRHFRLDADAVLARATSLRRVPGPATLGEFVSIDRIGAGPGREWMAVLADSAEVVVPADAWGEPSSLAIAKAVSIVQSRAYLERRALQLLVPHTRDHGDWRLVTLDFGQEAQHHGCEFLMCFAFQPANSGELSITSPYVEIGFSLPVPTGDDPVFVLTVRSASPVAGQPEALLAQARME